MQPFLVNVQETPEEAYAFVDTVGVTMTVLLDDDGALYNGYDLSEMGVGGGPFPVFVVIDREGVITWFERDSDAAALRDAIDAAL